MDIIHLFVMCLVTVGGSFGHSPSETCINVMQKLGQVQEQNTALMGKSGTGGVGV